jgi:hypothetical protein
MAKFYYLRFETPPTSGPRSPSIYIPLVRGGATIAQSLVSLFVASYGSQG